MNIKIRTLIVVAAMGVLGVGEARGQAVATLGADTIALGGQTTLVVRRAHTYPQADALSADGSIVVLDQRMDSATHTQTTTITSFEPGVHYLRLGPDDSLALVVADYELDSNDADLRDIAPLQRVPYTLWEVMRWVLLGIGVVALAALVWWLVERKRRHGSIIVHHEPQDTRTPERRALDALEGLRQERLWQQGKQKEYHTALTDILRRFIEESTGIRATEMTSDETVEALETESGKRKTENEVLHQQDNRQLIRSAATELKGLFATADMVKFAKSEPQPHEHERSMTGAVEFVRRLWQAVGPKEEEASHE